MINIVIPMAGLGSRFSNAGFIKPKPFIDVLGLPMIERVIQNLEVDDTKFYLIAQEEHITKESELVNYLKSKYNVVFLPITKLTEGTACTVLYAKRYIDNNSPLIIANSDQIVDISIKDFIQDSFDKCNDGHILTFIDKSKNNKWSFVKKDEDGNVVDVKEKIPISEEATVGIYFFSKGSSFVDSAIQMIIENNRVNNEFYTCPVYSYMINNGMKIGTYEIPIDSMNGIGTPEDLEKYIFKINNTQ